MRVLHIGKFFPPFAGGMEYFLADLLPALHSQGITVAALVHAHPSVPAAGPQPGQAIPLWRAPCYGRLLYAPISPTFPLWLARAIDDFSPTILHLHLPNTSAFWALAVARARRLPWIIHWHADVVSSQLDRRLALAYQFYRPLERRLLATSQAIIATSPDYLNSSTALRPWQAKCQVIPLGLNPERIPFPAAAALTQAAHRWGNASFKVLAVGRLTYYKGHETLIDAVAGIPKARLIIVGTGERRLRLENLLKTLGLQDRITLTDFLPEAELHALLATGDVLCLPSLERTEAFGMVLLEAMRFQKPVVASDIPGSGVGWVVRQGRHGLLIPPNDPDVLVRALRELAESPQRRAELGQAGRLALQAIFDIKQVAEQMRSVYETVCHPQR